MMEKKVKSIFNFPQWVITLMCQSTKLNKLNCNWWTASYSLLNVYVMSSRIKKNIHSRSYNVYKWFGEYLSHDTESFEW